MRRAIVLTCLVGLALSACTTAARPAASTPPSSARPDVVGTSCAATSVPVAKGARPLPLPRNPTGAEICLANEPPAKRQPGAQVDGQVARTLLRLIVTADVEPATDDRCGARSPLVLVRFNGPNTHKADVPVVLFDRCHAAYLGSAAFDLPRVLGDFLLGLAAGGDPTAMQRLVGMPMTAARRAARDSRRSFVLVGELTDERSAPGSVLLQWASEREANVIVAVRPSRPCRAADLDVRYRAGGAGAGMDVGTLFFGNRSNTWCELRGPIRITGLDRRGAPVTPSAAARVADALELAPGGDALQASTLLTASYRDDPNAPNGLCEPHWVVPKIWRVDVGGGVRFASNAQGRVGDAAPGMHGLVTCRGRFGADRVALATD